MLHATGDLIHPEFKPWNVCKAAKAVEVGSAWKVRDGGDQDARTPSGGPQHLRGVKFHAPAWRKVQRSAHGLGAREREPFFLVCSFCFLPHARPLKAPRRTSLRDRVRLRGTPARGNQAPGGGEPPGERQTPRTLRLVTRARKHQKPLRDKRALSLVWWFRDRAYRSAYIVPLAGTVLLRAFIP